MAGPLASFRRALRRGSGGEPAARLRPGPGPPGGRGLECTPMTERRDRIDDARVATRARFARLVAHPDPDIDLALAALVIAGHGRPAPDESAVLDHLDRLADLVRLRLDAGDPTDRAIDRLHDVLYREKGYRGPT